MKDNIKGYLIEETPVVSMPKIISNDPNKPITIQANLQDADVKNRNKRCYTRAALEYGISTPYAKERLAHKAWFGEAGHPLKPDMQRQMYIDQLRISHIIKKVWFEGNILKGLIESANTTVGRDFKGLIEQGSEVAFSMRGVGPVVETRSDYVIVNSPLNILTWDWVIHPSHSIAYMENILTEDTMSMLTGQDQFSLREASDYELQQINSQVLTEGLLTPLHLEEIKDYIKNSSKNYKNLSESFEFDPSSKVELSPDRKSVNLYQNSSILKICLEDYITEDIDYFLLNNLG